MHAIFDFFIQYTMLSCLHLEVGYCVHCVNSWGQNTDWYVNRHCVDCIGGAVVIYTGCQVSKGRIMLYTSGFEFQFFIHLQILASSFYFHLQNQNWTGIFC